VLDRTLSTGAGPHVDSGLRHYGATGEAGLRCHLRPPGRQARRDGGSPGYSSVIGFTELPNLGDELHHFGWNACSSALCPGGGHDHTERRYLIVPGLRSSGLYVLDTQPDPAAPQVTNLLGPEELGKRANYSRPHTVHCGPGGSLSNASRHAPGAPVTVSLDHAASAVLLQVANGPATHPPPPAAGSADRPCAVL
jgi:56kDa selenium binding protein (SBP56)